MKNTLRLFQLLLAVSGGYALYKYSDNGQAIAVASVILIALIDSCKGAIIKRSEPPQTIPDSNDRAQQQLACLRQSKSIAVINGAIQDLLRDLGLTVRPNPNHHTVDLILDLPEQDGRLGIKIINEVNEPRLNWDQWPEIKEFNEADEDQRLLLIAHNLVTAHGDKEQHHVNFPNSITNLLNQHKVTAMTSLSFCHLYQLCKEANQQPSLIFRRIYQHTGGVFEI